MLTMHYILPQVVTYSNFFVQPFLGCVKVCLHPWVSPTAIHIKALWAFQRLQYPLTHLVRENLGNGYLEKKRGVTNVVSILKSLFYTM